MLIASSRRQDSPLCLWRCKSLSQVNGPAEGLLTATRAHMTSGLHWWQREITDTRGRIVLHINLHLFDLQGSHPPHRSYIAICHEYALWEHTLSTMMSHMTAGAQAAANHKAMHVVGVQRLRNLDLTSHIVETPIISRPS
eukprot:2322090-Amphidinium_carterae.2